jgi:hypothetical protein
MIFQRRGFPTIPPFRLAGQNKIKIFLKDSYNEKINIYGGLPDVIDGHVL